MHYPSDDSTRESAPLPPPWAHVFGILAIVLIVILVIALLVGGNHGPSRHSGALPIIGLSALMRAGGHYR